MSPATGEATTTRSRSTTRRRRRVVEPVRHTVAGHEIVRRVTVRGDLPREVPRPWLDELARARRSGLLAWIVLDPHSGREVFLVTNPPAVAGSTR